jgi:hypothetical protein
VSLAANLKSVQERIQAALKRSGRSQPVTIVAITKTHPPDVISAAYEAGLTHIGENRVQEAATKFPELPLLPQLTRHMVGHLQTNKVNKALALFDTLDAVDSLRLAQKIGRRALQLGREVPVLLEVNTSGEETKFGFKPEAIDGMLACIDVPGIRVEGLMTIGPLTPDLAAVRRAFVRLRRLQTELNRQLPARRTLYGNER